MFSCLQTGLVLDVQHYLLQQRPVSHSSQEQLSKNKATGGF
jgi:hypothetical protein